MTNYAPNYQAPHNYRNGENAWHAGLRDAEHVLRRFEADHRGTACDYWFCEGYHDAATHNGVSYADAKASLRFVDPVQSLTLAEDIRRVEIICEEQTKRYGRAPMQWKLDRLRAKALKEASS